MAENIPEQETINNDVPITEKNCFIITPVGPDNSPIRRAAEGVIKSGIIPVLDKLGFTPKVPHWLTGSGSITKSVINLIVNSDLCIVNLTGLNPNVMYELGIRHSARKPVIHICEVGTDLPFDIKPERTIFYINDMLGIENFKKDLRSSIDTIMQEENQSNPVYDAIQSEMIMKKIETNSTDLEKFLVEEISNVKNSIHNININIEHALFSGEEQRVMHRVDLGKLIDLTILSCEATGPEKQKIEQEIRRLRKEAKNH